MRNERERDLFKAIVTSTDITVQHMIRPKEEDGVENQFVRNQKTIFGNGDRKREERAPVQFECALIESESLIVTFGIK